MHLREERRQSHLGTPVSLSPNKTRSQESELLQRKEPLWATVSEVHTTYHSKKGTSRVAGSSWKTQQSSTQSLSASHNFKGGGLTKYTIMRALHSPFLFLCF